ncbi:hypothetical protein ACU4GI_21895 [Cupriavidus basilensis]
MVNSLKTSSQARLSDEQISILCSVLGRVSAEAIGKEVKIRFGVTIGRAERRRVAALIKESRGSVARGFMRLRTTNADIELLSNLARYYKKTPADLLGLMLHRALAELVSGGVVSLRTDRLSLGILDAYLRTLSTLLPADGAPSPKSRLRAHVRA